MKRRQLKLSLVLVTALLVVLMAGLAGGSLWILRRLHDQTAHTEAARQVLEEGAAITAHLADQAIVRRPAEQDADWTAFSEEIRAMHAIEDGLQSVSVIKNGVTVFHEQTRGLTETDNPTEPKPASTAGVTMSRRLLDLGAESVPVVVFNRRLTGDDGTARDLEVAMRRETVAREEYATAQAIGSMFQLSLLTVAGCFAICAVLVVWMMRRESQRERLRREEEHLAFAGVLANGIVHDFRNPMSAMRLDVQMLNREVGKGHDCKLERAGELAGRIQHTLDRMDKVFQEFLYLSKPPADQREVTDLVENVRECVALLRPRFEMAGVDVQLDLPGQPVQVLAYASALQRALMNVIINAEQVSSRGSTVRVRVLQTDHTALVDVTDSGPGVPAADRQKIFEMFYTTRPGGTGLGLFLAKTALERCGGSIQVLDASPKGACFRLSLLVA